MKYQYFAELLHDTALHDMETISTLLALCERNHQKRVDVPHKGQ